MCIFYLAVFFQKQEIGGDQFKNRLHFIESTSYFKVQTFYTIALTLVVPICN